MSSLVIAGKIFLASSRTRGRESCSAVARRADDRERGHREGRGFHERAVRDDLERNERGLRPPEGRKREDDRRAQGQQGAGEALGRVLSKVIALHDQGLAESALFIASLFFVCPQDMPPGELRC